MPGQIFVEDRQVVCPGDLLAEGEFEIPWSPYIYKEKNRYYSTVVGLVDVKNGTFTVIPLKGSKYLPKVGDTVLGIIEEVELYGWSVDIKAPYPGYLPASALLNRPVSPGEDLRRYLDVGDYVAVKIEVYDRTTGPILTAKGSDLGKINDGSVIEVSPAKIPRVIGKNRSMINMMATMTGCHINAYPNGMIHVRCPTQVAEEVLKEAISIIERESQTKGLTERIKQFISSKLGEGNAGSSAEA